MVKAHEGKLRKKQSCFRCGEIYGERSVIEKVQHIIGKRIKEFCSFMNLLRSVIEKVKRIIRKRIRKFCSFINLFGNKELGK